MTAPRATDGRRRIVVVGGGQNCEHEVSLASAKAVAAALDADRYDICSLTIGLDGAWRDAGTPDQASLPGGAAAAMARIAAADVVFPAVHGPRGEDGSLAGLCEVAGVAYVGSGVRAGALAMDKWATKLVAGALGIETAPGILVTAGSGDLATSGLTPPLVVKPVAAGSSRGVTRVDGRHQLGDAIRSALDFDERALVEELVLGREIDVAVLDWPNGTRLVGPPLEIRVDAGGLFDTQRKYDGTAEFLIPADLTETKRAALASAASALFDALGCAGVARFDFFVTRRGVVLNEVNTMPGMTEQSQVPKMFAAVGLTYPELLDVLVEGALARHHSRSGSQPGSCPPSNHAASGGSDMVRWREHLATTA